MTEYQEKYLANIQKINELSDIYSVPLSDFDSWYQMQISHTEEIRKLKNENINLLNRHLFSTLDNLHDASEDDIHDLEEFSDKLMDWINNLDCGLYVLIHDSLLSLYRFRKDRNNIIKELYKLGMGLYYLDRKIQGLEKEWSTPFRFTNEMVFTEAGSYIRFFEDIEDTETKGYIIRALANIAICTPDNKRKVAVSSRILKIIQDDYYRNLAPELPWDVFLRRSQQQMSSNRSVLSKGDLNQNELAEILEACQVVFEPEKNNKNPNIRWLWPYYEMEYTCGFVDIQTTLDRIEEIINGVPDNQYDQSSLYANVQLAIYYGRLLKENPSVQKRKKNLDFLKAAYQKMMKVMMNCPPAQYNDFYHYLINLVFSNYYETEGVETYKKITTRLMRKVIGLTYIDSQKVGKMIETYCAAIFRQDKTFFDDIPFIGAISDETLKKEELRKYSRECGLYYNFGLIKMTTDKTELYRAMLENEFQMYKLHVHAGHDDLKIRESTERFADIAFGHHRWYNEAGGYPDEYVRNNTPYRQMVDIVAVASYMKDNFNSNFDALVNEIISLEHKQFSPIITSYLHDRKLTKELKDILCGDDKPYYLKLYNQLTE
ncbi:MAG: hypothetical protein IJ115_06690 [Erysipelotrichaceae bacterium]|nr:hypothetical protein [Erysipelotrichaceae bacterium]